MGGTATAFRRHAGNSMPKPALDPCLPSSLVGSFRQHRRGGGTLTPNRPRTHTGRPKWTENRDEGRRRMEKPPLAPPAPAQVSPGSRQDAGGGRTSWTRRRAHRGSSGIAAALGDTQATPGGVRLGVEFTGTAATRLNRNRAHRHERKNQRAEEHSELHKFYRVLFFGY